MIAEHLIIGVEVNNDVYFLVLESTLASSDYHIFETLNNIYLKSISVAVEIKVRWVQFLEIMLLKDSNYTLVH